ncbi:hypothetical protein BM1_00683 [Bipolaris maydis]|nr:hypothetical protein BM1_00683 [Bipolaris maydis]
MEIPSELVTSLYHRSYIRRSLKQQTLDQQYLTSSKEKVLVKSIYHEKAEGLPRKAEKLCEQESCDTNTLLQAVNESRKFLRNEWYGSHNQGTQGDQQSNG